MAPLRLRSESRLPTADSVRNLPAPTVTDAQLATATNLVAQYIRAQQARYHPLARQMSTVLRRRIEGFFPEAILDDTALCVLAKDRVEDPPFYAYLTGIGFKNLPSFSQMAAITFVDVVVTYEKVTRSLLFHELVHAVQFQHLGIENFARFFVHGFARGASYESIPLEQHARELEQRFVMSPSAVFSVDAEVRRWIRQATL